MRAVLDTSVLIGAEKPRELEGAISPASLAELHFGVGVAQDADERARRGLRLGVIESTFEPLRSIPRWRAKRGRLAAAVRTRGGQPRRRALDLAIAAHRERPQGPAAHAQRRDFQIIGDLVDVRTP